MTHVTCKIRNEGDDIVNKWYSARETSGTVMKLLQVITARADDDKDDDDGYWHP